MAHKEQREFCERVKKIFPDHFKNAKVLDIGSLDINGNNKYLFENSTYIGLDIGKGPNVDVVSLGHLYDAPDAYFDTIISTEAFEHDMHYEKTIENIIRMLKPGGLFLFTCAAPGRPEHGTRNSILPMIDAPFLINISEEWADYYKNLNEDDIKRCPSFNITFPDGHFEINDKAEIPSDLYFYGIKGGLKYQCNVVPIEELKSNFQDDIFVIGAWPDNNDRENTLIRLIKRLKVYGIPILIAGHYPIRSEIQKMVDFYLFDKNNPILMQHEFSKYDINSVRWTEFGGIRIENHREFHHDFAIWATMRNAFNFCNYLGKKYIHYIEYDNFPDIIQYRQAFLEPIRSYDAVLYEYLNGSSNPANSIPYTATFIFSIRTDIAIKTIDSIKTREDFFMNKPDSWQLERNFYGCLKKITSNISISKYIPNNNELNTEAVWNRDGINRNGLDIQLYLAVDEDDDLYLHTILENEQNCVIEVCYDDYKKFHTITGNKFFLYKLGKFKKGYSVVCYNEGQEIFREYLGKDVQNYRKINTLVKKNQLITPEKLPQINIHFVDGPFVEIKEDRERLYHIQFINTRTNKIEYELDMKSNHWARASLKYYTDWVIKIQGMDNRFYYEHHADVTNKRILVAFESKSLGDTLAWIPYVDKFRIDKKCQVICSTFYNSLFKEQYPEIEFIEPGEVVHNIYALYRIGVFLNYDKWDNTKHLIDPKKLPLTKIASDILGLDYMELKPKLPVLAEQKKNLVSIGVHGTAQCKYWNHPTGWQEVVDFLKNNGYQVRLLSKEEDGYMGNKNPKGVIKIVTPTIEDALKAIQESKLFIGVSSGLSWLSWAARTETILISGFTNDYIEPRNGIRRIINTDVCHGCWSRHIFDKGDWNWCPDHKGTDRQFECSKTITPQQVIEEIKIALGL